MTVKGTLLLHAIALILGAASETCQRERP
jgi:hypothetical protein